MRGILNTHPSVTRHHAQLNDVTFHFPQICICAVGRDSVVGIATCYGMEGLGIESWGEGTRFSSPVQTGRGNLPASYTMGTGSLVDHPPTSNTEVKERVELYLWAFVACSRVNFTFSLTFIIYFAITQSNYIMKTHNSCITVCTAGVNSCALEVTYSLIDKFNPCIL
jgi:hypothetical protein